MGSQSPVPLFVGRQRERAAVVRALARLGDRQPQWVSVIGEAGIGKSRLLGELAAEAVDQGCLVLTGRGLEFEREVPFGVWVDALDDYLGAWGSDGISAEDADLLAAMFPSLAGPGRASAGSPRVPTERFRLHRAVRALLGSLAVGRPVVVVIDDLQWVDLASAELLAYLLRRPPTAPVLLAVAFRAGQAPAGLGDALAAAAREDGGAAVWLSPLTFSQARELFEANGQPTGAQLRRCYELSGGNPFYLQQLARQRSPVESWTVGAEWDVPASVRVALAHEIAALSTAARALAEGAAVAGEPFMLDLAGRAADLPVVDAEVAVDELLAADVVRHTEVPRRYRFRHPIVRHAVYVGAAEHWRIAAHRRVAQALAAAGASVPARAHHVQRYARMGDEDAALLLRDAARLVSGHSPAAAAGWLQSALDVLPAGSFGLRLELSAELAETQLGIGRLEEARRRLVEVLDMIPADARARRVRVVVACAATEHLLGQHEAADRRLHRALAEIPGEPTPEAAALRVEVAAAAAHRAEFERSIHWAQLARSAAEAVGQPCLTAAAAAIGAFARACAVTTVESIDDVRGAVSLISQLTDTELAERADAFLYLANAAHWSELFPLAEELFRRGVALSRASGHGQFLTPMWIGLSHTLVALGKIPDAVEQAEAAVEAAWLGGVPQLMAWALTNQAWALAASGDLTQALAVGIEAAGIVDGAEEGLITASVHGHLGAICAQAGELDRCLAEFAAAGAPEFRLFSVDRRCLWYARLAEAELAGGRLSAAARWSKRGEETAVAELPVAGAAVARARARLMLHTGDAARAAQVALASADAALARGARLEAAGSRLLAGQALAAAGDHAAAREALIAARNEFDECGAPRYRDEADTAVRDLDPSPPDADELAALSSRERQIADLVAQGQTNRQIAADLYLSAKTVEYYLTHVYAKLGVRSRAGLAEIIGRARANRSR